MDKNTYGLYQTFNKNIPKKKISVKQKKELIDEIKKFNEKQSEAFIMLIFEHNRIENNIEYDLNNGLKDLPYEGTNKNNDIIFDISNMPPDLCWILYKFSQVVNIKTEED